MGHSLLVAGGAHKIPIGAPNLSLMKSDVNHFNDIASLFHRFCFDYVFHFAAVVGVQRTLGHPLWDLGDIKGIENILRLSKNAGVVHVHFASSSEICGEPFESPQNENTTPLNSRLVYVVVKNVGEVYLRTFERQYGLSYIIFRFFNTYGPRQSEDFVLLRFVRAALTGEPLQIYGDASQTRTFCYVDDRVGVCVKTLLTSSFEDDVINIGSDEEMTILALAKTVLDVIGSQSEINFLPPLKEGDMIRRCPDVSKMRQLFDRPLVPIKTGISRQVNHSGISRQVNHYRKTDEQPDRPPPGQAAGQGEV